MLPRPDNLLPRPFTNKVKKEHEIIADVIGKSEKQFNINDSLQIGIYTRTIKAPTGKKSRNYGLKIQIDDDAPFELR